MSQLVFADNVKESASYSGTGTVNLGGAFSSSVRTFVLGMGNGARTAYKVDDGNGNWENRIGTIASGTPDTITNDTFVSSSTGSAINFTAGTKTISCVPMCEMVLTPAITPCLKESDIASATTTDLGTLNTLRARVTGTTTITGFGSQPNTMRWVRFAGALTLTHNATSLILLGGANRTTAADDVGLYISDSSGNWRELSYFRAAFTLPEKGTFTPTITYGGAAVGLTYSTQVGRYTKSGNRCVINGVVNVSANGSSAGAALINGLPFASANVANAYCQAPVNVASIASSVTAMECFIAPNESAIQVYGLVSGVNTQITNSYFPSTPGFVFGASYETAP